MAAAVWQLGGVPVFDATVVQTVVGDVPGRGEDHRVALGIGPAGEEPVAYVLLCPCEGVAGLLADLADAAAVASEYHLPHAYAGSWQGETR